MRVNLHRFIERKRTDQHILGTYDDIRVGMGFLALLFPPVLVWVGWVEGVPLQPSMSAYYFAGVEGPGCVFFPVRAIMVGLLCAICFGLVAYRGFSRKEDWWLNAAAVFGFLIAWIPNDLDEEPVRGACAILQPVWEWQQGKFIAHDLVSALMFVCLGFVIWCCSRDTLYLLPKERDIQMRFRRFYKALAIVMWTTLLLAWPIKQWFTWDYRVFAVEVVLLETFAVYWLTKWVEFRISKADRLLAKTASRTDALRIQRELHPRTGQVLSRPRPPAPR